jgi:SAM-dependent methyltransferase
MNKAYTFLAQFYDELMDVDYNNWANYLIKYFDSSSKTLLDLGCGTAHITNVFHENGYKVVGVDSSLSMLNYAWEIYKNKFPILHQDIRDLELGQKFDVIISTCDVINYITSKEDLVKVFGSVFSHLEEGGTFLFDISSSSKLMNALGDNTFAEQNEEFAYIWENEIVNDIVVMNLSFFIYDKEKNSYNRYEEKHTQKIWEISEVKNLLDSSGFTIISCYEGFTSNAVTELSDRVQFVVKKKKT